MRTILATILAAVLAVLALAGTAPASARAAADLTNLELGDVQGYNAVGADRIWNRNAEWIDIRNTANDPVNVQGLIVEDSWRHGQPDSYAGKCNRFTVSGVPMQDGALSESLPESTRCACTWATATPRCSATAGQCTPST
ncbi:hypothetical protein [Nonomuraea bangladeshensis]|uniref:hypothetical protein n=1 Tax=Nonomuraea bangladeshensis TaxID=404385 RepID=UPI003C2B9F06